MKKILLISVILLLFSFLSFNVFAKEVEGSDDIKNYGEKTTEYDELYGFSKMYKRGSYDRVKMISEDNFKNSYIYLPRYYYTIFKYDKPLDALTKRMSNYYYLKSGNYGECKFETSSSYSSILETDLTLTSSSSVALNSKASANLDIFKIEQSLSNSICLSSEVSIKLRNEYSYSSGYSLSTNITPKDYDTWWYLEARAHYDVYKIYTYEIEYETTITTHKKFGKKYHTYSYKTKAYNLYESSYEYSYIENTLTYGIYEYIPTASGKYKYNGDRFYYYTYLD